MSDLSPLCAAKRTCHAIHDPICFRALPALPHVLALGFFPEATTLIFGGYVDRNQPLITSGMSTKAVPTRFESAGFPKS